MRDALIIPTYGFITPDETLSGGQGTKKRIEKARQLIRNGIIARDCIMSFPQTMTPRGYECELIGFVSLGKNVAEYVRNLPEFSDAAIDDTLLSSGTFDDTIASLKSIYFEMEGNGGGSVHVHFVSDWSQLGRLWLIWHLAFAHQPAMQNWKVSFHVVPNFRTMRDVWGHEPLAYLKCLWCSLWYRFTAV